MTKLTASVGPSKANQLADVKAVQHLIIRNKNNLIPFILPQETGVFDQTTARLIVEFQRRWVKMPMPDGIVDPGGRTLATMIKLAPPEPPEHVRKFIEMALPAARAVQKKWGVPASVLIAQGAQETGWGRYVKGNAYSGIKG
jgi:hypothetical protein